MFLNKIMAILDIFYIYKCLPVPLQLSKNMKEQFENEDICIFEYITEYDTIYAKMNIQINVFK